MLCARCSKKNRVVPVDGEGVPYPPPREELAQLVAQEGLLVESNMEAEEDMHRAHQQHLTQVEQQKRHLQALMEQHERDHAMAHRMLEDMRKQLQEERKRRQQTVHAEVHQLQELEKSESMQELISAGQSSPDCSESPRSPPMQEDVAMETDVATGDQASNSAMSLSSTDTGLLGLADVYGAEIFRLKDALEGQRQELVAAVAAAEEDWNRKEEELARREEELNRMFLASKERIQLEQKLLQEKEKQFKSMEVCQLDNLATQADSLAKLEHRQQQLQMYIDYKEQELSPDSKRIEPLGESASEESLGSSLGQGRGRKRGLQLQKSLSKSLDSTDTQKSKSPFTIFAASRFQSISCTSNDDDDDSVDFSGIGTRPKNHSSRSSMSPSPSPKPKKLTLAERVTARLYKPVPSKKRAESADSQKGRRDSSSSGTKDSSHTRSKSAPAFASKITDSKRKSGEKGSDSSRLLSVGGKNSRLRHSSSSLASVPEPIAESMEDTPDISSQASSLRNSLIDNSSISWQEKSSTFDRFVQERLQPNIEVYSSEPSYHIHSPLSHSQSSSNIQNLSQDSSDIKTEPTKSKGSKKESTSKNIKHSRHTRPYSFPNYSEPYLETNIDDDIPPPIPPRRKRSSPDGNSLDPRQSLDEQTLSENIPSDSLGQTRFEYKISEPDVKELTSTLAPQLTFQDVLPIARPPVGEVLVGQIDSLQMADVAKQENISVLGSQQLKKFSREEIPSHVDASMSEVIKPQKQQKAKTSSVEIRSEIHNEKLETDMDVSSYYNGAKTPDKDENNSKGTVAHGLKTKSLIRDKSKLNKSKTETVTPGKQNKTVSATSSVANAKTNSGKNNKSQEQFYVGDMEGVKHDIKGTVKCPDSLEQRPSRKKVNEVQISGTNRSKSTSNECRGATIGAESKQEDTHNISLKRSRSLPKKKSGDVKARPKKRSKSDGFNIEIYLPSGGDAVANQKGDSSHSLPSEGSSHGSHVDNPEENGLYIMQDGDGDNTTKVIRRQKRHQEHIEQDEPKAVGSQIHQSFVLRKLPDGRMQTLGDANSSINSRPDSVEGVPTVKAAESSHSVMADPVGRVKVIGGPSGEQEKDLDDAYSHDSLDEDEDSVSENRPRFDSESSDILNGSVAVVHISNDYMYSEDSLDESRRSADEGWEADISSASYSIARLGSVDEQGSNERGGHQQIAAADHVVTPERRPAFMIGSPEPQHSTVHRGLPREIIKKPKSLTFKASAGTDERGSKISQEQLNAAQSLTPSESSIPNTTLDGQLLQVPRTETQKAPEKKTSRSAHQPLQVPILAGSESDIIALSDDSLASGPSAHQDTMPLSKRRRRQLRTVEHQGLVKRPRTDTDSSEEYGFTDSNDSIYSDDSLQNSDDQHVTSRLRQSEGMMEQISDITDSVQAMTAALGDPNGSEIDGSGWDAVLPAVVMRSGPVLTHKTTTVLDSIYSESGTKDKTPFQAAAGNNTCESVNDESGQVTMHPTVEVRSGTVTSQRATSIDDTSYSEIGTTYKLSSDALDDNSVSVVVGSEQFPTVGVKSGSVLTETTGSVQGNPYLQTATLDVTSGTVMNASGHFSAVVVKSGPVLTQTTTSIQDSIYSEMDTADKSSPHAATLGDTRGSVVDGSEQVPAVRVRGGPVLTPTSTLIQDFSYSKKDTADKISPQAKPCEETIGSVVDGSEQVPAVGVRGGPVLTQTTTLIQDSSYSDMDTADITPPQTATLGDTSGSLVNKLEQVPAVRVGGGQVLMQTTTSIQDSSYSEMDTTDVTPPQTAALGDTRGSVVDGSEQVPTVRVRGGPVLTKTTTSIQDSSYSEMDTADITPPQTATLGDTRGSVVDGSEQVPAIRVRGGPELIQTTTSIQDFSYSEMDTADKKSPQAKVCEDTCGSVVNELEQVPAVRVRGGQVLTQSTTSIQDSSYSEMETADITPPRTATLGDTRGSVVDGSEQVPTVGVRGSPVLAQTATSIQDFSYSEMDTADITSPQAKACEDTSGSLMDELEQVPAVGVRGGQVLTQSTTSIQDSSYSELDATNKSSPQTAKLGDTRGSVMDGSGQVFAVGVRGGPVLTQTTTSIQESPYSEMETADKSSTKATTYDDTSGSVLNESEQVPAVGVRSVPELTKTIQGSSYSESGKTDKPSQVASLDDYVGSEIDRYGNVTMNIAIDGRQGPVLSQTATSIQDSSYTELETADKTSPQSTTHDDTSGSVMDGLEQVPSVGVKIGPVLTQTTTSIQDSSYSVMETTDKTLLQPTTSDDTYESEMDGLEQVPAVGVRGGPELIQKTSLIQDSTYSETGETDKASQQVAALDDYVGSELDSSRNVTVHLAIDGRHDPVLSQTATSIQDSSYSELETADKSSPQSVTLGDTKGSVIDGSGQASMQAPVRLGSGQVTTQTTTLVQDTSCTEPGKSDAVSVEGMAVDSSNSALRSIELGSGAKNLSNDSTSESQEHPSHQTSELHDNDGARGDGNLFTAIRPGVSQQSIPSVSQTAELNKTDSLTFDHAEPKNTFRRSQNVNVSLSAMDDDINQNDVEMKDKYGKTNQLDVMPTMASMEKTFSGLPKVNNEEDIQIMDQSDIHINNINGSDEDDVATIEYSLVNNIAMKSMDTSEYDLDFQTGQLRDNSSGSSHQMIGINNLSQPQSYDSLDGQHKLAAKSNQVKTDEMNILPDVSEGSISSDGLPQVCTGNDTNTVVMMERSVKPGDADRGVNVSQEAAGLIPGEAIAGLIQGEGPAELAQVEGAVADMEVSSDSGDSAISSDMDTSTPGRHKATAAHDHGDPGEKHDQLKEKHDMLGYDQKGDCSKEFTTGHLDNKQLATTEDDDSHEDAHGMLHTEKLLSKPDSMFQKDIPSTLGPLQNVTNLGFTKKGSSDPVDIPAPATVVAVYVTGPDQLAPLQINTDQLSPLPAGQTAITPTDDVFMSSSDSQQGGPQAKSNRDSGYYSISRDSMSGIRFSNDGGISGSESVSRLAESDESVESQEKTSGPSQLNEKDEHGSDIISVPQIKFVQEHEPSNMDTSGLNEIDKPQSYKLNTISQPHSVVLQEHESSHTNVNRSEDKYKYQICESDTISQPHIQVIQEHESSNVDTIGLSKKDKTQTCKSDTISKGQSVVLQEHYTSRTYASKFIDKDKHQINEYDTISQPHIQVIQEHEPSNMDTSELNEPDELQSYKSNNILQTQVQVIQDHESNLDTNRLHETDKIQSYKSDSVSQPQIKEIKKQNTSMFKSSVLEDAEHAVRGATQLSIAKELESEDEVIIEQEKLKEKNSDVQHDGTVDQKVDEAFQSQEKYSKGQVTTHELVMSSNSFNKPTAMEEKTGIKKPESNASGGVSKVDVKIGERSSKCSEQSHNDGTLLRTTFKDDDHEDALINNDSHLTTLKEKKSSEKSKSDASSELNRFGEEASKYSEQSSPAGTYDKKSAPVNVTLTEVAEKIEVECPVNQLYYNSKVDEADQSKNENQINNITGQVYQNTKNSVVPSSGIEESHKSKLLSDDQVSTAKYDSSKKQLTSSEKGNTASSNVLSNIGEENDQIIDQSAHLESYKFKPEKEVVTEMSPLNKNQSPINTHECQGTVPAGVSQASEQKKINESSLSQPVTSGSEENKPSHVSEESECAEYQIKKLEINYPNSSTQNNNDNNKEINKKHTASHVNTSMQVQAGMSCLDMHGVSSGSRDQNSNGDLSYITAGKTDLNKRLSNTQEKHGLPNRINTPGQPQIGSAHIVDSSKPDHGTDTDIPVYNTREGDSTNTGVSVPEKIHINEDFEKEGFVSSSSTNLEHSEVEQNVNKVNVNTHETSTDLTDTSETSSKSTNKGDMADIGADSPYAMFGMTPVNPTEPAIKGPAAPEQSNTGGRKKRRKSRKERSRSRSAVGREQAPRRPANIHKSDSHSGDSADETRHSDMSLMKAAPSIDPAGPQPHSSVLKTEQQQSTNTDKDTLARLNNAGKENLPANLDSHGYEISGIHSDSEHDLNHNSVVKSSTSNITVENFASDVAKKLKVVSGPDSTQEVESQQENIDHTSDDEGQGDVDNNKVLSQIGDIPVISVPDGGLGRSSSDVPWATSSPAATSPAMRRKQVGIVVTSTPSDHEGASTSKSDLHSPENTSQRTYDTNGTNGGQLHSSRNRLSDGDSLHPRGAVGGSLPRPGPPGVKWDTCLAEGDTSWDEGYMTLMLNTSGDHDDSLDNLLDVPSDGGDPSTSVADPPQEAAIPASPLPSQNQETSETLAYRLRDHNDQHDLPPTSASVLPSNDGNPPDTPRNLATSHHDSTHTNLVKSDLFLESVCDDPSVFGPVEGAAAGDASDEASSCEGDDPGRSELVHFKAPEPVSKTKKAKLEKENKSQDLVTSGLVTVKTEDLGDLAQQIPGEVSYTTGSTTEPRLLDSDIGVKTWEAIESTSVTQSDQVTSLISEDKIKENEDQNLEEDYIPSSDEIMKKMQQRDSSASLFVNVDNTEENEFDVEEECWPEEPDEPDNNISDSMFSAGNGSFRDNLLMTDLDGSISSSLIAQRGDEISNPESDSSTEVLNKTHDVIEGADVEDIENIHAEGYETKNIDEKISKKVLQQQNDKTSTLRAEMDKPVQTKQESDEELYSEGEESWSIREVETKTEALQKTTSQNKEAEDELYSEGEETWSKKIVETKPAGESSILEGKDENESEETKGSYSEGEESWSHHTSESYPTQVSAGSYSVKQASGTPARNIEQEGAYQQNDEGRNIAEMSAGISKEYTESNSGKNQSRSVMITEESGVIEAGAGIRNSHHSLASFVDTQVVQFDVHPEELDPQNFEEIDDEDRHKHHEIVVGSLSRTTLAVGGTKRILTEDMQVMGLQPVARHPPTYPELPETVLHEEPTTSCHQNLRHAQLNIEIKPWKEYQKELQAAMHGQPLEGKDKEDHDDDGSAGSSSGGSGGGAAPGNSGGHSSRKNDGGKRGHGQGGKDSGHKGKKAGLSPESHQGDKYTKECQNSVDPQTTTVLRTTNEAYGISVETVFEIENIVDEKPTTLSLTEEIPPIRHKADNEATKNLYDPAFSMLDELQREWNLLRHGHSQSQVSNEHIIHEHQYTEDQESDSVSVEQSSQSSDDSERVKIFMAEAMASEYAELETGIKLSAQVGDQFSPSYEHEFLQDELNVLDNSNHSYSLLQGIAVPIQFEAPVENHYRSGRYEDRGVGASPPLSPHTSYIFPSHDPSFIYHPQCEFGQSSEISSGALSPGELVDDISSTSSSCDEDFEMSGVNWLGHSTEANNFVKRYRQGGRSLGSEQIDLLSQQEVIDESVMNAREGWLNRYQMKSWKRSLSLNDLDDKEQRDWYEDRSLSADCINLSDNVCGPAISTDSITYVFMSRAYSLDGMVDEEMRSDLPQRARHKSEPSCSEPARTEDRDRKAQSEPPPDRSSSMNEISSAKVKNPTGIGYVHQSLDSSLNEENRTEQNFLASNTIYDGMSVGSDSVFAHSKSASTERLLQLISGGEQDNYAHIPPDERKHSHSSFESKRVSWGDVRGNNILSTIDNEVFQPMAHPQVPNINKDSTSPHSLQPNSGSQSHSNTRQNWFSHRRTRSLSPYKFRGLNLSLAKTLWRGSPRTQRDFATQTSKSLEKLGDKTNASTNTCEDNISESLKQLTVSVQTGTSLSDESSSQDLENRAHIISIPKQEKVYTMEQDDTDISSDFDSESYLPAHQDLTKWQKDPENEEGINRNPAQNGSLLLDEPDVRHQDPNQLNKYSGDRLSETKGIEELYNQAVKEVEFSQSTEAPMQIQNRSLNLSCHLVNVSEQLLNLVTEDSVVPNTGNTQGHRDQNRVSIHGYNEDALEKKCLMENQREAVIFGDKIYSHVCIEETSEASGRGILSPDSGISRGASGDLAKTSAEKLVSGMMMPSITNMIHNNGALCGNNDDIMPNQANPENHQIMESTSGKTVCQSCMEMSHSSEGTIKAADRQTSSSSIPPSKQSRLNDATCDVISYLSRGNSSTGLCSDFTSVIVNNAHLTAATQTGGSLEDLQTSHISLTLNPTSPQRTIETQTYPNMRVIETQTWDSSRVIETQTSNDLNCNATQTEHVVEQIYPQTPVVSSSSPSTCSVEANVKSTSSLPAARSTRSSHLALYRENSFPQSRSLRRSNHGHFSTSGLLSSALRSSMENICVSQSATDTLPSWVCRKFTNLGMQARCRSLGDISSDEDDTRPLGRAQSETRWVKNVDKTETIPSQFPGQMKFMEPQLLEQENSNVIAKEVDQMDEEKNLGLEKPEEQKKPSFQFQNVPSPYILTTPRDQMMNTSLVTEPDPESLKASMLKTDTDPMDFETGTDIYNSNIINTNESFSITQEHIILSAVKDTSREEEEGRQQNFPNTHPEILDFDQGLQKETELLKQSSVPSPFNTIHTPLYEVERSSLSDLGTDKSCIFASSSATEYTNENIIPSKNYYGRSEVEPEVPVIEEITQDTAIRSGAGYSPLRINDLLVSLEDESELECAKDFPDDKKCEESRTGPGSPVDNLTGTSGDIKETRSSSGTESAEPNSSPKSDITIKLRSAEPNSSPKSDITIKLRSAEYSSDMVPSLNVTSSFNIGRNGSEVTQYEDSKSSPGPSRQSRRSSISSTDSGPSNVDLLGYTGTDYNHFGFSTESVDGVTQTNSVGTGEMKDEAIETDIQEDHWSDELERLRRERQRILDMLGKDVMPSKVQVELAEAQLNYIIGQTDTLLSTLDDPEDWDLNEIQQMTSAEEKLTELREEFLNKHRVQLESSRREIEEQIATLEREKSMMSRSRKQTRQILRLKRNAELEAFKLEREREQATFERTRNTHYSPRSRSDSPVIRDSSPESTVSNTSFSSFISSHLTPRQMQRHLIKMRKGLIKSGKQSKLTSPSNTSCLSVQSSVHSGQSGVQVSSLYGHHLNISTDQMSNTSDTSTRTYASGMISSSEDINSVASASVQDMRNLTRRYEVYRDISQRYDQPASYHHPLVPYSADCDTHRLLNEYQLARSRAQMEIKRARETLERQYRQKGSSSHYVPSMSCYYPDSQMARERLMRLQNQYGLSQKHDIPTNTTPEQMEQIQCPTILVK